MSLPIEGGRRTPRLFDADANASTPDTVPPFLSGQPAGEKPWRLRDPEGVIRGPYGLHELRSLHENGRLGTGIEIAPLTEETWCKVSEHALWAEITRRKPKWSVRQPSGQTTPPKAEPPPLPVTPLPLVSPEPAPTARSVPPISILPPRYVAAVAAGGVDLAEARDIQDSWVKLRYHRWAQVLLAAREIITFFFFMTAADALAVWVPGQDTADLAMAICALAVCAGYYTWRAFSRTL